MSPAAPPPAAPFRVTWAAMWLRCDSERRHCAVWADVARREGRVPDARLTEGEAIFEKLCGMIALVERNADLAATIRDLAAREKAAAGGEPAAQSETVTDE